MKNNYCLLVFLLLLVSCKCIEKNGPDDYLSSKDGIIWDPSTGQMKFLSSPNLRISSIAMNLNRVANRGKKTTVMHFSITAKTSKVWIEPGDTFIFSLQTYPDHPESRSVLKVVDEVGEEVAVENLNFLTSGTILAKIWTPLLIRKGEARSFKVLLDSSKFEVGDRMSISLNELQTFVADLTGERHRCNIKTTLRFVR